MNTIRQILSDKGDEVYTTAPDETVFEALRTMAEKNIGALVVCDNGKMAGLISERDYARKVILEERASKSTSVSEIMSAHLVTVHPDETIDACMQLMTDKHIRHLVVVEDDKMAGVVSIVDIVKAINDSQKFKIERLEDYILTSG